MISEEHRYRIPSEYGYEDRSIVDKYGYVASDGFQEGNTDISICLASARYASSSQTPPESVFMPTTLLIESNAIAGLVSDCLQQNVEDNDGETCSFMSKLVMEMRPSIPP